jgi:hypothetical protein
MSHFLTKNRWTAYSYIFSAKRERKQKILNFLTPPRHAILGEHTYTGAYTSKIIRWDLTPKSLSEHAPDMIPYTDDILANVMYNIFVPNWLHMT